MINYDFTYNELLYFLLIFVRVASFVFVAPFFSMGNTPARIRAGLSFFITLLLYHTLPETEIVYNGLYGDCDERGGYRSSAGVWNEFLYFDHVLCRTDRGYGYWFVHGEYV